MRFRSSRHTAKVAVGWQTEDQGQPLRAEASSTASWRQGGASLSLCRAPRGPPCSAGLACSVSPQGPLESPGVSTSLRPPPLIGLHPPDNKLLVDVELPRVTQVPTEAPRSPKNCHTVGRKIQSQVSETAKPVLFSRAYISRGPQGHPSRWPGNGMGTPDSGSGQAGPGKAIRAQRSSLAPDPEGTRLWRVSEEGGQRLFTLLGSFMPPCLHPCSTLPLSWPRLQHHPQGFPEPLTQPQAAATMALSPPSTLYNL